MKINWLSRNVRSIISLLVVVYGLNFFSLILIMKLGTPALIDRMETSLKDLIIFVLGYYFSASHINPNTTETKEKKDIEVKEEIKEIKE